MIKGKLRVNGETYDYIVLGLSNCKILNVDAILDGLRNLEKLLRVTIQVFDAEYIASAKHLLSSFVHAVRAFKRGTSVSKTLSMEVLLYAAATRQIKPALGLIGVKDSTDKVAFFIAGEEERSVNDAAMKIRGMLPSGCVEEDEVLSVSRGKAEFLASVFGVSGLDLVGGREEIADLVIKGVLEKIALLDLQK